jgi:hypothetical protein
VESAFRAEDAKVAEWSCWFFAQSDAVNPHSCGASSGGEQLDIAVGRDFRFNTLMSAIELEDAVQSLPPEDLERFAEWFERFIDNQWDRKLESDIASGRLAAFARKADADFEAGRCAPL